MPEGDALPFGRSRHRAYEDITRALVKGVDVDDLEPMTSLLHAKRGSVGHEINALRSEIARVQSTLSTIKERKGRRRERVCVRVESSYNHRSKEMEHHGARFKEAERGSKGS